VTREMTSGQCGRCPSRDRMLKEWGPCTFGTTAADGHRFLEMFCHPAAHTSKTLYKNMLLITIGMCHVVK
jgi:hypothetical protein